MIGSGANTAVGLTAPETAAAVRAGIPAMAFHPFMIDKAGAPMTVCANPSLPIDLAGLERLVQLAGVAATEALEPLSAAVDRLPELSMFLAVPEDRPGRPPRLEHTIAEQIAAAAKPLRIAGAACHASGHAGGLLCMEQALLSIQSGRSHLCLVGGVDSYLAAETLEWLDTLDQLHSENTIWGFCPGEAAGFCVLASQDLAQELGIAPDLELVAAASALEPSPIKTETVCIGQGLSEVFRKSLRHLPDGCRIDQIICDMNGEPYRADEYGFAVLRTTDAFADDADCKTPADCWGDVGAASGPLFAMLAGAAAANGYGAGPSTFLWASSESGLRGAALVRSSRAG